MRIDSLKKLMRTDFLIDFLYMLIATINLFIWYQSHLSRYQMYQSFP